jgi:hypothetical protein
MNLPRFKNCECGHLGSQHREDRSCARCSCERFKHPSRVYTQSSPITNQGRPVRHLGARPQA